MAEATKKTKLDAIQNVLTGLNRKYKDKRVHVDVIPDILSQKEAEDLYACDHTARKIVDRVPKEGTRKWIEITNTDLEEKALFLAYMKNIKAKSKITRAWQWSRLYGGAALYVNIADGKEPHEPINWASAKTIKSLVVLHRYELIGFPNSIETNIDEPNFGFPNEYLLQSKNGSTVSSIHHSRIIRFDGAELPHNMFVANNYWHDSVLSAMKMPIINYAQSHDSIASVIQDFRQRILKIDGLAAMLSNDEDNLIQKRMEIQDLMKSIFKTDVLDKEDDLNIIGTPLTGLKDVLELVNNRLVVASNFPHTIMLGESPGSGLNTTGDSQNRDWYDHIADEQEDVIEQPIAKLLEMVMRVKDGPTKGDFNSEIGFEFKSLWQMSDKDRADLEKVVAEKDAIYHSIGVLTDLEIAEARYGTEKFSQDTTVDLTQRDNALNMEDEPDESEE